MPFEYSKLLGRIKEKYSTQANFAKAMNLSERSVSQKMNGKCGWKQQEMVRACKVLNIEVENIPEYFFTINVQTNEQTKENKSA